MRLIVQINNDEYIKLHENRKEVVAIVYDHRMATSMSIKEYAEVVHPEFKDQNPQLIRYARETKQVTEYHYYCGECCENRVDIEKHETTCKECRDKNKPKTNKKKNDEDRVCEL